MHRDVQTSRSGRRGDLAADPSGADDDERAAAVEPLPQRVAVRHAAQVEHAVEVAAGDREPARLGAGREQQPVVAQPLAVVEHDFPLSQVQLDRGPPDAQLDGVVGVEALGLDVDRLALGVAAEIVLRQRRALVRTFLLGADQRDAPVEAFLAQCLGGLCAGQSGADDDERLEHQEPGRS